MFVKLEEVFGSVVSLNESADEKKFLKAFEKATGFKTHIGGRSYFGPSIGSAQVNVNLYDCLNYNKRLPRPGVYGDLEIKSATPMSKHEQAEMVIAYEGVEINCKIDCFYPPRVSKANTNKVIDLILKQAGVKADYEIAFKNHQPEIELSEENFNKIAKIKVGDKIGDFLVYDAGMVDTKSVERYYIVMTSYKEQFAMHVSKNSAINESTSLNEPEMFESTLFADLNSVDEKTLKDIVKNTFKVLGTKVGRDVSVYDNCIEVTTGLITTAKLEAGVVKMGSYSGIKFVSYEEGKSGNYDRLIVEYNGELYPIAFQVYTGYADLRFAKAGELLKDFSKKYRISTDNADVNPYSKANTLIRVSEAEFKKLPSLVHRGDEIGDAVVVGVGEDSGETRLFRGKNFHVTIVTPKHQAGFTFIPENYVSGLREDEAGDMNESTVELNEVTGLPKHKTSVPSHLL